MHNAQDLKVACSMPYAMVYLSDYIMKFLDSQQNQPKKLQMPSSGIRGDV